MANKYGLTPDGFGRKRLPEIQSSIFDRLDTLFGSPVSRKPNSVIGIIVGIVAAALDDLWQLSEDTYNAMYPSTASGVQLDNAVSFAGVRRKNAEKTVFYPVCYGQQNTALPKYAQIQGNDGQKYELVAAANISSGNCVSIALTIPAVMHGLIYTITIDGSTISCTASPTDSALSIMACFLSLLPQAWTGKVENDVLQLDKADRQYGSSITVSTTLSVLRVGSPLKFVAEAYGAVEPPLKSVS